MTTYTYMTKGVCSRRMTVELEDGIIRDVRIEGGCNGNLQGISRLVIGMKAEDAIARMQGIHCGGKPTSCPDQLSIADAGTGKGQTVKHKKDDRTAVIFFMLSEGTASTAMHPAGGRSRPPPCR